MSHTIIGDTITLAIQVMLTVATVLSTLSVAGLFFPLRSRVQRAVDRRFFRRKYDAAQTLAAFGATACELTDLEQLVNKLVGVVDETMRPEHLSLWLRPLARPAENRAAAVRGGGDHLGPEQA